MDKFETVIENYTVTITVDLPCSEQEYEEFAENQNDYLTDIAPPFFINDLVDQAKTNG